MIHQRSPAYAEGYVQEGYTGYGTYGVREVQMVPKTIMVPQEVVRRVVAPAPVVQPVMQMMPQQVIRHVQHVYQTPPPPLLPARELEWEEEPIMAPMRNQIQRAAPPPEEEESDEEPIFEAKNNRAQRAAAPPAPRIEERIVEKEVVVEKIIEVEVEKTVERIVEREVEVERIVERIVEVPVEVERRVEIEVPFEKIVHVEKEVERVVYKDVPVPVQMSNERVVVREIPVPVEVVKEVPVPVERVVYKEVLVPTESADMDKYRSTQSSGFYGSPAALQGGNLYGSLQGKRMGLGLVLERSEYGITIKDLVQGLAAHKSGQLQQGDVLVSVDGRSVESYDLDQIKTLTIGDEGTACQLQVRRGQNVITVNLSRTNS